MLKSPFEMWQKAARKRRNAFNLALKVMPRLERLEKLVLEQQREQRLFYNSLGLPAHELWLNQPPLIEGQPGNRVFANCTPCRQDSFEQPYFSYWTQTLGEGLRYHRKIWEFVFICQALHERGLLAPDKQGLGFGVGEEPLSAYFASRGCRITATDIDLHSAREMGWTDTKQHAMGKEALRKPYLCPDPVFDSHVDFQTFDMNADMGAFEGYDFCWSACALEHLGSIEHGLDFIERSVETLKPGGWAVHTTELNTSSNDETVDHMNTVLFRQRDLAELSYRLSQKGHHMAPLDFAPGKGPIDRYIDAPPYREQPHLQIALEGYSATSYGILVQRGPA